ncbi:RING/U-box superfamily protein [Abeliophyllum distichum]|uniref:RING/U-box superfamily protein n=1 Tax=Abeliophyllum distichum TaxID=126358 RepID=A0ABD1UGL2_9LAMI
MTKTWFSIIFSWLSTVAASGLLSTLMRKTAVGLLACILALGGVAIGVIAGAIKGQTTETGFLRGAGVGAMAGVLTALQFTELIVNGEPFSKVALISCSLVNGKIFMEWLNSAVLKAYQWQVSTMETSSSEVSDIFEVNSTRGLSIDEIKKLPSYRYYSMDTVNCTICLQDFENGDCARMLPSCRHSHHLHCIDEWLIRNGTCPICREGV